MRGYKMNLQSDVTVTREYGGYLPLELPKGQEYYRGEHVVALNSGRYAIVYALLDGGWERIYLPCYLCRTVETAIRRLAPHVDICYYHIDRQFLPMNVYPKERECILWVNYFGIQPETVIDQMTEIYKGHLILDHTQSFFSVPRDHVYQVYSCRKFFGVCDGSYVIGEGIRKRPLEQHYSSAYFAHLIQSHEHGTNHAYRLNKENEMRLNNCGMGLMSSLTRAILKGTDYFSVRDRRLANMKTLHGILGPYNELQIQALTPAMNYPFLCPDRSLRERLVASRIYVPQLWRETAENEASSQWEKYLSEHLCLLPVDQRYGEADMYTIGQTVLELIKEEQAVYETQFYYTMLSERTYDPAGDRRDRVQDEGTAGVCL